MNQSFDSCGFRTRALSDQSRILELFDQGANFVATVNDVVANIVVVTATVANIVVVTATVDDVVVVFSIVWEQIKNPF